jgi:hypothetical protein
MVRIEVAAPTFGLACANLKVRVPRAGFFIVFALLSPLFLLDSPKAQI